MKRFLRLLAVVSLVMMVIFLGGLLARTSTVRADTTTPDTSDQDQGTQLPSGVTPEQPQEQASQQVFFYKDGQLAGVDRQVTGGAQVAGFTISELLKGPTEDEKNQGYSTQLPEGVKMLYYTESNDGKTFGVDLSAELQVLQGDAVRTRQALDQVIKTAQVVSGDATVNITINGEDAWQALGVSQGNTSGSSNLWWIILVAVLGTLTLSGTSLMLLAMRRNAALATLPDRTKATKPIKSTARKSIKVSRPTEKKKRIRFSRKAGKQ